MKRRVAEQLADYVVRVNYSDFSKASVNKAKLCLMDTLACMVGGGEIETGRILLSYHEKYTNPGICTVIGSKTTGSATHAAFINASLCNALDLDDTYLGHVGGHLGSTVIPAALSVAEMIAASGKDLLQSVLLGYEISRRICASIEPYVSREYIFGFGTWQCLGAVITAGKLLGLGSQEIANSIGIAGCNAPVPSVVKTVFNPLGPNMVKNNYGVAAEVGVKAALLATEGFTGPVNLFEGESGFWRMCGASNCDLERITEGLGEEKYKILNVRLKAYPVCGLLQSAVEASISIMKTHNLLAEDIKKIAIKTCPLACKWPFNNSEPKTAIQAQFSLPYSVSVAISGVAPGPNWFSEEMLHHQAILMRAKKVELLPDRKIANSVISNPATVKIETNTRSFSKTVKIPKGHPYNPFSAKDVENKFAELSTPALDKEKVASAIESIRHLESLNDITELTHLFRMNLV